MVVLGRVERQLLLDDGRHLRVAFAGLDVLLLEDVLALEGDPPVLPPQGVVGEGVEVGLLEVLLVGVVVEGLEDVGLVVD